VISAASALGALPPTAGAWTRGAPELVGDRLALPWSDGAAELLVPVHRPLRPALDGVPKEVAAAMATAPAAGAWPTWRAPLLVLTSGVPRSGTSWLDRIARALVRSTGAGLSSGTFQGGRDDDFPTNAPGDREDVRLRALLASGRVGHCAKTHFLAGDADTERPSIRLLYAWRDPRDVVLSTCWYALAGPAAAAFGGMPRAEAFARVTAMVLPPLVASLRAAVDAPPNTLLVPYASLIEEPVGQIRRIADHLGIALPEGFAAAAAAGLRFEREAGRARGEEDRASYHRKGVVGGWRSDLPGEQIAAIEAALPDLDAVLDRLAAR
jgi:hypothetical protein